MIDNKTQRLELPLPNVDNYLEDDVGRLADSLHILDEKVATVGGDGLVNPDQLPSNLVKTGDDGKIPVEKLPSVALTDTFPVSSEAEMLALDAQPGDVAIRDDESKSFILMAAPATVLGNWKELVNDALLQLAKIDGEGHVGIASYADIRSYSGAQVRIQCYGKDNVFDGANGLFARDDSDSTSADNGGTILVDAKGRRWKRVYNGSVKAEWFGAKGDGNTNDTAAIQAAMNYISSNGGGVVEVVAKNYIAAGLILPPKVKLKGQGVSSTTIKAPNGWNALAILASVDFEAYSNQAVSAPTVSGSYASSVEGIFFHGNYDNFGGTPSKYSGNGLAIAGTTSLNDVEVQYVPATGLIHLSYEGGANSPPSYWPADKGQYSVNTHERIAVKWCKNDCIYIENYDSIYKDILGGMASCATGGTNFISSFWDPTRTCAVAQFCAPTNIRKGHFYSCNGWGVVFGHGDYSRYPALIRYDNIVCETVASAMWARPSCTVQAVSADFHNINMALSLPEITEYGTYTPGYVIQSGKFVAGKSESRLPSDYGTINMPNYTVSGSNPTLGFQGTHGVVAGENNRVNTNTHRSRFLDPALGGIGVMLAGINNRVTGQIIGFLGTASDGGNSCAIQVQPGSRTDVDIIVRRCNEGLRWTTNASQPSVTGRIMFDESVTTPVLAIYKNNANLYQRGRLTLETSTGSNRQSVVSAASAVDVTISTQQTITISGLNLPYVPSRGEVTAHLVTEQANTQSLYVQAKYVEYRPELSTTSALVFVVAVIPATGTSAGVSLRAKLN